MQTKILKIKGRDIQVGDIFNNRMVTYRQKCSNSIAVRFHNDMADYFLFSADVLIRRPVCLTQAHPLKLLKGSTHAND